MKKAIILITMVSVLLVSAEASYAINTEGPMRKLGRGVANVFTSPVEIAKSVGEANYEAGPVAAITYGFLKGLYKAGVRAAVGIFEVVTFPFPLKENYAPILTDPEFFFSDGMF